MATSLKIQRLHGAECLKKSFRVLAQELHVPLDVISFIEGKSGLSVDRLYFVGTINKDEETLGIYVYADGETDTDPEYYVGFEDLTLRTPHRYEDIFPSVEKEREV